MKKEISAKVAIMIIFILAVLAITLIFVFEIYMNSQESVVVLPDHKAMAMEFSVSECEVIDDKYEDAIKDLIWTGDNSLEVMVYTSVNCTNEIKNASYGINGDKITLKFEDYGSDATDCICASVITYKFSSLFKKDYQFEIVKKKLVEPPLD